MRPLLTIVAAFFCCIGHAIAATSAGVHFQQAEPVWPAALLATMNAHAGFRATIQIPPAAAPQPETILRVAAADVYRVFINGEFAGYGPARAAAGYARLDEWPVTSYMHPGRNLIAIETVGYGVNSFYLLKQPPFLQAELVAGDRVLAATHPSPRDTAGFAAVPLAEFEVKTQRYSFQRPFGEVYRLYPAYDRWRRDPDMTVPALPLSLQPQNSLLPRRVPLPDFTVYPAPTEIAEGDMRRVAAVAQPWKDRSLTLVPSVLDGYPESQIPELPSIELQHWIAVESRAVNAPLDPNQQLLLTSGKFTLADFGLNRAGFLRMHLECSTDARVYASFDEVLTGGDVDFKRLDTVNVVAYHLQPGIYDLETLEPYVIHYLKVMALSGRCMVSHLAVRDYSNPDVWRAQFSSSDPRLNRIFAAARETFRQNSVDLFTDCPSRERAAWTGDSFFTARAATRFSDNTLLEKNFFENFALPASFPNLPPGMVPMLYPGDAIGKDAYIPGYSLWFVLQLSEYLDRSHDKALVEALRPRVLALLKYFAAYRNSDGMIENLQGWVFLEWSDANKYTNGVNFPYNMMYAAALDAAGRMYALPELQSQAEALRARIRAMAYDGHFFVDHAVRIGDRLAVAPQHTEAAQYFAFFFATATRERYPELAATLVNSFGPQRATQNLYPDVAPSNVIFGKLLRIELLSQWGENRQLVDEAVAGFLSMAETTGTLWEHVDLRASTDHGLMSHLAFVLYRDVLGIAMLDRQAKRLKIVIPNIPLDSCSGSLPTADGPLSLHWEKAAGRLRYHLDAPPGYQVQVENHSGLPMEAE